MAGATRSYAGRIDLASNLSGCSLLLKQHEASVRPRDINRAAAATNASCKFLVSLSPPMARLLAPRGSSEDGRRQPEIAARNAVTVTEAE